MDVELVASTMRDCGAQVPPIRWHEQVGSTNDLALEHVRSRATGMAEFEVVGADRQTAGRGRFGRTWLDGAESLLFSVIFRHQAVRELSWLPLASGLAVAEGVRSACVVPARVKWPNDVVIDGPGRGGEPGPRKLAGLLLEVADAQHVVIGIGLNVALDRENLPTAQATALNLEGSTTPREVVLGHVLARLLANLAELSAIPARYRGMCLTLGQQVRVEIRGAEPVFGTAIDVDDHGRLVVRPDSLSQSESAGPGENADVGNAQTETGDIHVSAGDVFHVRPASGFTSA